MVDFSLKYPKNGYLYYHKLVLNDFKLALNDQIWSNFVEFDQKIWIRPNSTLEFKIWNSKNQNSNEFEQISPSLINLSLFPSR